MKTTATIADRLQEVLLDGRWIANTNYQAIISSVNWQQATQQVADLNTIALLTFHVDYYLGGLVTVLDGGPLEIRDKHSFDMPPVQSEADWQALVDRFLTNARRFVAQVRQLPVARLSEAFVDEKYGSYLRNIEGVIEHSYYHLGQMSLVRKLVLADGKI